MLSDMPQESEREVHTHTQARTAIVLFVMQVMCQVLRIAGTESKY